MQCICICVCVYTVYVYIHVYSKLFPATVYIYLLLIPIVNILKEYLIEHKVKYIGPKNLLIYFGKLVRGILLQKTVEEK